LAAPAKIHIDAAVPLAFVLARLSGSDVSASTVYTASIGFLEVVFRSDNSETRAGLEAEWSMRTIMMTECSGRNIFSPMKFSIQTKPGNKHSGYADFFSVGKGQGKGKGKPEGKGKGKGKGAGVGNTYVDPGRPKIFQPTDQDRSHTGNIAEYFL
jgi:hypothetical protein